MTDNAETDISTPEILTQDIPAHTNLPLLALRDVVVYPHMQIALFVGREQSVNAVNAAREDDDLVFVVAQRDSIVEEIDSDNLYQYGTVCRIVQIIPHESDDNCVKVLIEGQYRAKLDKIIEDESDFLCADISHEPMDIPLSEDQQTNLVASLKDMFTDYAQARLRNSRELSKAAKRIDDLLELTYFICTRASLELEIKQSFLENNDLVAHVNYLTEYLLKQSLEQKVEDEIQGKVKDQMDKNQREYFLNEKMKVVQNELSDMGSGGEDDIKELEKRIADTKLPKEIEKKCEVELRKLKAMPPSSSESALVRNYIDWILNTPWYNRSRVSSKIDKAEDVLNADHYGLDEVKDRILEFLAVQSRVKKMRGPILCLVGPPGVGKTSLGESIAKATGRKFVRMALGGVRDEAEIRGHRRTYIGAMPGKIVQQLAKVEVKNPLILLDEIDKMAQDFRGDPASALLEVLDPSQNDKFNDHYLDLDLDLSEVMFVCTSNSMDIPPALLDRMEVIRLPGYTEDEKVNIAERYLLPKAIQENGLKENELSISTQSVRHIVQCYTREAGVRNLSREISKICRKVVKNAVVNSQGKSKTVIKTTKISPKYLIDYLGVHPFDYGLAEKEAEVGRVTGLAWTQVGGELLTIEAASMKGKGNTTFTGSLGDVMQESIKAAMTVMRTRGDMLGISYERFKETDIHVHMPEGATPKDGPSAGGALTTALVSTMTGIAIRPDIAMTGEITLRGKILRIGGLKEKLLAAHRGGITHVLIPESNERDLKDIPKNVKDGLKITPVSTIDEVLALALVEKPKPLGAEPIPVDASQAQTKHS